MALKYTDQQINITQKYVKLQIIILFFPENLCPKLGFKFLTQYTKQNVKQSHSFCKIGLPYSSCNLISFNLLFQMKCHKALYTKGYYIRSRPYRQPIHQPLQNNIIQHKKPTNLCTQDIPPLFNVQLTFKARSFILINKIPKKSLNFPGLFPLVRKCLLNPEIIWKLVLRNAVKSTGN